MRISGSEDMASILVVDDDPDSRDVLTRSFSRAGYMVRSAENGRRALIAVATAVPDVIVLDVGCRRWTA
jgi:two-component system, OmpR family, KDP operon response regulator KdpE